MALHTRSGACQKCINALYLLKYSRGSVEQTGDQIDHQLVSISPCVVCVYVIISLCVVCVHVSLQDAVDQYFSPVFVESECGQCHCSTAKLRHKAASLPRSVNVVLIFYPVSRTNPL